MTHEEASRRIADYALGLANSAQHESIRVHLTKCPYCQEQLARERRQALMIRDALQNTTQPDPRLLSSLRPAIPGRRRANSALPNWQKRLAPALIMLLLLFGGLGLGTIWPGAGAAPFVSTASATAATSSQTPTPSVAAMTVTIAYSEPGNPYGAAPNRFSVEANAPSGLDPVAIPAPRP